MLVNKQALQKNKNKKKTDANKSKSGDKKLKIPEWVYVSGFFLIK